MGFILDSIVRRDIVIGPETISADYITDSIDISGIEDDFAVTFVYDNGASVNMNIYLQVSTDNLNFADVSNSGENITDNDGTHIWDLQSTGTSFLRVRIQVTGGSIDLQKIEFVGKRRH